MLTTHPSAVAQKKDLHIGGLGINAANPSGTWSARPHRQSGRNDTAYAAKLSQALNRVDQLVSVNPRRALTLAAVVGIIAGLLLAR